MNRLAQMREYLKIAERDPENNKFYIEDLKLSIEMFETAKQATQIYIGNGIFVDNEQVDV